MLLAVFAALAILTPSLVWAEARVMNPGEAIGQLVILSAKDVQTESPKFKSLMPLSIPVFEQLPAELAVVAGAITLQQQNLLSHVQLKSRARKTPNLDISELPGGMSNDLLKAYRDGDWIHMVLKEDGSILLEPSTEAAAQEFAKKRQTTPVKLKADYKDSRLFTTAENTRQDFVKVGSKAANYAELFHALNTPERQVVRAGFAVPFYYYQEFLEMNPPIKAAIRRLLTDPLMKKISKVEYRESKLKAVRDMIMSTDSKVSEKLVDELINRMDRVKGAEGLPRRFKLRSSTNSEDLPNFNGAGLYSSMTYKPAKKDKESSRPQKELDLKEALRLVWSSVWNFRALEERTFFQIPHEDVAMGIQIKPSFSDEDVDGVLITKNVSKHPTLTAAGVYFEAQRGDKYGVANPTKEGDRPEKILVQYDEFEPLNKDKFVIHVLQKSNIADDKKTILPHDNPSPIMTDTEIKDLVGYALKAHFHFAAGNEKKDPAFALDLEFKIDKDDTGQREIYYEQARPYID